MIKKFKSIYYSMFTVLIVDLDLFSIKVEGFFTDEVAVNFNKITKHEKYF